MFETLLRYQELGAQWLAGKSQALLADDMGLGKSAQAVTAADIVGADNVLVLCPASVRANWVREFRKFSPMDRDCVSIYTAKDAVPKRGVVICSYDLAVPLALHFKNTKWDVLILDEAHYLKDRSAQRTKAVYGRSSVHLGIIAKAKRVWRLTGTPAPNNASELYTHLRTAGVIHEPYWDFVFRFCDGFNNEYGFKITGTKNATALKKLLGGFMLRRKKEEVLKDLPPLFWQEVVVEASTVQLDPVFYEQIQGQRITAAQFLANMAGGEDRIRSAFTSTNPLAELSRMATCLATLRRYHAMAKLPKILDILEEELESGAIDKLVIFAIHMSVIETTRERLKRFGAKSIYGKTPPEKRQRHIDGFQKLPERRVLIGNITAAGTGITLTAAHEAVFLEQAWTPGDNAQAAMRLHRIGQEHPVRIRVFSLEGSVDQQVSEALFRKSRELTKFL